MGLHVGRRSFEHLSITSLKPILLVIVWFFVGPNPLDEKVARYLS
jgi:hypothetical protein